MYQDDLAAAIERGDNLQRELAAERQKNARPSLWSRFAAWWHRPWLEGRRPAILPRPFDPETAVLPEGGSGAKLPTVRVEYSYTQAHLPDVQAIHNSQAYSEAIKVIESMRGFSAEVVQEVTRSVSENGEAIAKIKPAPFIEQPPPDKVMK